MANIPVDATAFSVFGMQELERRESSTPGSPQPGTNSRSCSSGALDCFNCEIAKRRCWQQARRDPRARPEVVSQQCLRASRTGAPLHAARRADVVLLPPRQAPRARRRAGTASGSSRPRWRRRGRRSARLRRKRRVNRSAVGAKKLKTASHSEVLKTMRTHLCCSAGMNLGSGVSTAQNGKQGA